MLSTSKILTDVAVQPFCSLEWPSAERLAVAVATGSERAGPSVAWPCRNPLKGAKRHWLEWLGRLALGPNSQKTRNTVPAQVACPRASSSCFPAILSFCHPLLVLEKTSWDHWPRFRLRLGLCSPKVTVALGGIGVADRGVIDRGQETMASGLRL